MGWHAASAGDEFAALADRILRDHGHGRVLVAVDGMDAAHTGAFADGLADALRFREHAVFRASMTDFHKPRSERDWHGAGSAESRYRDAFNYSLLRRVLTDPYRMGGSTGFVTAGFDAERDAPIEPRWQTGPQDAVLIVDGPYLGRAELRELWHYAILLEQPRPDDAWLLYVADANPRAWANLILDDDGERPVRPGSAG